MASTSTRIGHVSRVTLAQVGWVDKHVNPTYRLTPEVGCAIGISTLTHCRHTAGSSWIEHQASIALALVGSIDKLLSSTQRGASRNSHVVVKS